MAWNPRNAIYRALVHEKEEALREKERRRRSAWGPLKRRAQDFRLSRKTLEILLAVAILLAVLLCACCAPFRTWFIGVIHAISAR